MVQRKYKIKAFFSKNILKNWQIFISYKRCVTVYTYDLFHVLYFAKWWLESVKFKNTDYHDKQKYALWFLLMLRSQYLN